MVQNYIPKRVIWKYEIPIEDVFTLNLPDIYEILTVQVQHGKPFVWALVDPASQGKNKYEFKLFGTGHIHASWEFPDKYIGTFQLENGSLVFHLFQVDNDPSHFFNNTLSK